MPKLTLFNRQLNVSSDDFVFAGSVEILLRTTGLLCVLVEYVRFHRELDSCSGGHMINTYLLGMALFFLITIVTDFGIVNVSMKGTVLNDNLRKSIPKMLYVRLGILVTEFLWTLMGTVTVLVQLSDCNARVFWITCAAVLGGWITAGVQSLVFSMFFDFKLEKHQAVITKHDWEKRWKNLFCCLNSEENKHVFATLSKLCVQLFKKEELVTSDILAGLILVYNRQKLTRQKLDVVDAPLISGRLRCKPHKHAISPGIPRQTWMTFEEAAHYMKFALGSYGWFYYIGLNNPVTATFKLIPQLSLYSRKPTPQIEGDGKYLANTAAFHLQTGIHLDDIVYACFHNEIYSIPFYVCIDTESRSVVVSIRGTLSLEDILTDLLVERAPVHVSGIHGAVHTGMLNSAKYMRNKLLTENILNTAFSRAEDYRLVITGHSLGAGIAALLAIELRPLYPDLICFAFAPPGELVSDNLIPYTEEFICSVVLGYDVVPRLGLLEAINLRIDVLNAIKECHLPKHQIVASGIWTKVFGKLSDHKDDPDKHSCDQVAWFEKFIEEEVQERERIMSHYEPLLPPGQILHVLEENIPKRPWNVKPDYYAEWTDAQTFREIVVSQRMIAHHFPDTLLAALQQLALAEGSSPLSKKDS